MLSFIVVIAIFIIGLVALSLMKSKYHLKFNTRVLTALIAGLLFGFILQVLIGSQIQTDAGITLTGRVAEFISLFGDIYLRALKFIVVPLILVAMTSSIMHSDGNSIKKIAPKVLSTLIITVIIASVIGIISIFLFNVDGNELMNTSSAFGDQVANREQELTQTAKEVASVSYAGYIASFVPTNIFMMLTGQGSTDTLSTVLFAMFLGYSILQVRKRKPEKVQSVIDFIDASKEVVLSMVKEVLKLTPFAIFSIITVFALTSSFSSFVVMLGFLAASYFAIIVMYIIHIIIIMINGLDPKQYIKKTWPVLLFGFGARSSMAALPMNIETQTDELGVDYETASLSASFGSSIGQNGCAGIYPSMVAILAAQIAGVDMNIQFFIMLVMVVAISSFGIAGVGGGATFAAISVLSIMGLDVTVAAILIGIEPLIDMARTALNISDSMLAGVITAKKNKTLKQDVYDK